MRKYRLADSARVCVTSQGSVFLDIRQDAYVGIDAEQSRALAPMVEGWRDSDAGTPQDEELSRSLADALHEQGLLTLAGSAERRPGPADLPDVHAELMAWEHMAPPRRVRVSEVLAFLRALLVALYWLKLRPFSEAVRRAEARKQRASHSIDLDTARRLLTTFTYIRLFVFSRRGRCLLDTLTLIEFLAAYRMCPSWVVGVQVRPFAAHAWVQHESWVLNGTVGFVRNYRPILVV